MIDLGQIFSQFLWKFYWILDMVIFTLWILDIFNFYKSFLALFANTVNILENIVFFEGLLFSFFYMI